MTYRIPKRSKFWPLPDDYGTYSVDAKKQARLALLNSWHDPNRPDILITSPENFEAAFTFFVDTYLRRASNMQKVFAREDCRWIPYWRKLVTHPSSAAVGFRGSSKTVNMVHILPQFIALCRPDTPICISEFNSDRTDDEINTLMGHLEDNELIVSEFGLQRPKKYGRRKWSSRQLDLPNGSQIRGVSIKAGHRGRHPLLFINDDIEKDEESANDSWREWYMETFFFKVIVGMLRPGSHFVWIGTFLNPVSCLLTVVKKLDDRFRNYRTLSCPLIVRSGSCSACKYSRIDDIDSETITECPSCGGTMEYANGSDSSRRHFGVGAKSMWPEYYSVDDAVLMLEGKGTEDQRIRAMGPTAFWTEMMNRPELGGDRVFQRSDDTHGYHIVKSGSKKSIHVFNGEKTYDFDTWLETLHVTAGVDPAASKSKQADFSAIVCLGFDPYGFCYALDAWQGRVGYVTLIENAMAMCQIWRVGVMVWEANTVGKILAQQVGQLVQQYREEGKRVPSFVPIDHHQKKEDRIKGTLEIPMMQEKVFFPVFLDGVDDYQHRNRPHIEMLIRQFDRYTLKGSGTGYDDLIDAFEMAYFGNMGYRPNAPVVRPEVELIVEELKEVGIGIDRRLLPHRLWTNEMWLEARAGNIKKETRKQGRPAGIWRRA